jgi:hypothetical protein
MSGMRSYYLSRMLVAVGFGVLFFLGGSSWWQAALVGGAAIAWFLWAPRSGRYRVAPELGVTALRRDERSQGINDAAGRNAFVVLMLATGAAAVYAGLSGLSQVPVRALDWLLILGVLVYFGSDFWLRRQA